jgi:hypothetical protein
MSRLSHTLPLVLILAAAPLHAHQDHLVPQYGGVTAEAGYFQVEAVSQGTRIILHLTQHGVPVAAKGAHGKLILLSGNGKSEAPLAVAGPHSLVAQFPAAPASGAKAVATIDIPGTGAGNVRFVLK